MKFDRQFYTSVNFWFDLGVLVLFIVQLVKDPQANKWLLGVLIAWAAVSLILVLFQESEEGQPRGLRYLLVPLFIILGIIAFLLLMGALYFYAS